MYVFTNGTIVKSDCTLKDYNLIVEGNQISRIIPANKCNLTRENNINVINCKNQLIVPGFIDIHSDFIENIISPRPGVIMDFDYGINEVQKKLVGDGITTIFHSITLSAKEMLVSKALRNNDLAVKLIEKINQYRESLINNRVHVRLELDNRPIIFILKKLIQERKVHLLSFNDHTPGQGQYRDLYRYRKKWEDKFGEVTDDEFESKINILINEEKISNDELMDIATIARSNGISIASHDDDSVEKLEMNQKLGVTISEFPISLEVARAARKMGMETIGGSPNALLGKSQSGNLSVRNAIGEKVISILASDYYPPSLLASINQIKNLYDYEFYELINLLSLNPARAVGIDDNYGSLEEGKIADLLIIDRNNVLMTMISGKIVYQLNCNDVI